MTFFHFFFLKKHTNYELHAIEKNYSSMKMLIVHLTFTALYMSCGNLWPFFWESSVHCLSHKGLKTLKVLVTELMLAYHGDLISIWCVQRESTQFVSFLISDRRIIKKLWFYRLIFNTGCLKRFILRKQFLTEFLGVMSLHKV